MLLDPLKRLALDARLRLAAAKKTRFAAYDNKRKVLVTELEERERAFKKSRLEQEKQKFAKEGENDRIKEAGRRMREERERRLEELARAKAGGVRTEASFSWFGLRLFVHAHDVYLNSPVHFLLHLRRSQPNLPTPWILKP